MQTRILPKVKERLLGSTEAFLIDAEPKALESKLPDYLSLVGFVTTALWVAIDWYERFHHPPVDTYIGILAFVAAIATLWPPQNRWAKA